MKKIKFLIASMIGAIALVFACVFGSVNVNATTNSIVITEFGTSNTTVYNANGVSITIGSKGKMVSCSYTDLESNTYSEFFQIPNTTLTISTNNKKADIKVYTCIKTRTTTFTGSINRSITKDSEKGIYIDTLNNVSTATLTTNANGAGVVKIVVSFATTSENNDVTPLIQSAKVGDYTYIRFISIIYSTTALTVDDVDLTITMEYSESLQATKGTSKSIDVDPYVVTKITSSGDTYIESINDSGVKHKFENENNNEYYAVYVLRFTTSIFEGSTVRGTFTYNGSPYETTDVTI